MTGVRARRHTVWWVGLALIAVLGIVAALVFFRNQSGDHRDRPQNEAAGSDSSLLALTWGPSLCTVDASVRGCRTGNVGRKGQAFLLHGLWPQPSTQQYCGVTKQSGKQKGPELPEDVRQRLAGMMSDASVLAPHEWFAHGTCSGVTATEYFSIATTLTTQATAVLDAAFRDAQGRKLTVRSVRDLFDARFGAGSGGRVALACRKAEGRGEVVYEVRLSLPSVRDLRAAGSSLSLGEQLAKAPPVPAGCGQARVP